MRITLNAIYFIEYYIELVEPTGINLACDKEQMQTWEMKQSSYSENLYSIFASFVFL